MGLRQQHVEKRQHSFDTGNELLCMDYGFMSWQLRTGYGHEYEYGYGYGNAHLTFLRIHHIFILSPLPPFLHF
jgi:hypothetical protein